MMQRASHPVREFKALERRLEGKLGSVQWHIQRAQSRLSSEHFQEVDDLYESDYNDHSDSEEDGEVGYSSDEGETETVEVGFGSRNGQIPSAIRPPDPICSDGFSDQLVVHSNFDNSNDMVYEVHEDISMLSAKANAPTTITDDSLYAPFVVDDDGEGDRMEDVHMAPNATQQIAHKTRVRCQHCSIELKTQGRLKYAASSRDLRASARANKH
jgi:hypothetical protein